MVPEPGDKKEEDKATHAKEALKDILEVVNRWEVATDLPCYRKVQADLAGVLEVVIKFPRTKEVPTVPKEATPSAEEEEEEPEILLDIPVKKQAPEATKEAPAVEEEKQAPEATKEAPAAGEERDPVATEPPTMEEAKIPTVVTTGTSAKQVEEAPKVEIRKSNSLPHSKKNPKKTYRNFYKRNSLKQNVLQLQSQLANLTHQVCQQYNPQMPMMPPMMPQMMPFQPNQTRGQFRGGFRGNQRGYNRRGRGSNKENH